MSEEQRDADWPSNYFNYFTEVEEHFQKARGTGLFLLSPLDWALIESWKNAGVPLTAVIRGIDLAFEKWRSRRSKVRSINSVAYCAQAVLAEAQLLGGIPASGANAAPAPFTAEELRAYLEENVRVLDGREETYLRETAAQLTALAQEAEAHYRDLEELERRLTAMEEKMAAHARTAMSEELLLNLRRELDSQLQPYRGKMTTEQLAMLQQQYLDRRVFEHARLPRLSLFYL